MIPCDSLISYRIDFCSIFVVNCFNYQMFLGIHMLEIANGPKDALIHADFTGKFILERGPSEIASIMGIDLYVAKIIFNAAKKAVKANGSMQQENDFIRPIKATR